jgi:hypothetical protein
MTNEKIEQIKAKCAWYKLEGKEGVLMYDEDNDQVFFPFSEMSDETADELISGEKDVCATYTDSYGGESYGEEIDEYDMVNIENEQNIIYGVWETEDNWKQDKAKRELALTNEYYDWSNTVADRIYGQLYEDGEMVEELSISQADIDNYNDNVTIFNQHGDAESIKADMTAEKIEEILNNNANQVR